MNRSDTLLRNWLTISIDIVSSGIFPSRSFARSLTICFFSLFVCASILSSLDFACSKRTDSSSSIEELCFCGSMAILIHLLTGHIQNLHSAIFRCQLLLFRFFYDKDIDRLIYGETYHCYMIQYNLYNHQLSIYLHYLFGIPRSLL
jgi:hypothetical protein